MSVGILALVIIALTTASSANSRFSVQAWKRSVAGILRSRDKNSYCVFLHDFRAMLYSHSDSDHDVGRVSVDSLNVNVLGNGIPVIDEQYNISI